MSALICLGVAIRRFRLSGAWKLGVLLVAAQAALFEGVVLQPSNLTQASAAVAAPLEAPSNVTPAALCRQEAIVLDEGYGLRGQETRIVCGR